jgi:arginyl-tRNA synthetase
MRVMIYGRLSTWPSASKILFAGIAASSPRLLQSGHLAAQRFNIFYHHHRILSEQDPARRALLVAITSVVRRQLIRALDILGIEAPDRM